MLNDSLSYRSLFPVAKRTPPTPPQCLHDFALHSPVLYCIDTSPSQIPPPWHTHILPCPSALIPFFVVATLLKLFPLFLVRTKESIIPQVMSHKSSKIMLHPWAFFIVIPHPQILYPFCTLLIIGVIFSPHLPCPSFGSHSFSANAAIYVPLRSPPYKNSPELPPTSNFIHSHLFS